MVTPIEKGLDDVARVMPVEGDGNAVAYMSQVAQDDASGFQGGSLSIARRGANGWTRKDASAALPAPDVVAAIFPGRAAADYSNVLLEASHSLAPEDTDIFQIDVFGVREGGGAPAWLSKDLPGITNDGFGNAYLFGASDDLRRVVLHIDNSGMPPSQIFMNDGGAYTEISVLPDGTSNTTARVAARPSMPSGIPFGALGGPTMAPNGGAHAVAADARRVFWYGSGSLDDPAPLYLSELGGSTIPVSESQRAGDPPGAVSARFIGASPDGNIAFFSSDVELTDGASPGGGIYRWTRSGSGGTPELELLTGDPGDPLGLSLTSAIASDDASRVYFVSQRALDPDAVDGERNAYVWDADGLDFLGSVGMDGVVARVSRDGNTAVFTSTASVGGAPNNGRAAIYVHTRGTAGMVCASCRADGSPSAADAQLVTYPKAAIPPQVTQPRNVSDDGRVFFTSDDRLVPDDIGDGADVYEFHNGTRALLTSGRSDFDSYLGDNTNDGRSVFIITREQLVPQDIDVGNADLYVVRTGGGIPYTPPVPPADCRGDDCQGGVSLPPTFRPPTSATSVGPGNETPPEEKPKPKRALRLPKLSSAKQSELARRGVTTVPVRITGGGTIRVVAKTGAGRTAKRVGSATRTVRSTQTVTANVTVRLSRSARRQLRAKRRLRLTIEVSMSGVETPKRTTFTLRTAQR